MRVFVCLPIYKEVLNIERVVQRVAQECVKQNLDYQIIALDDASNDGTLELLQRLSQSYTIHIMSNAVNEGFGPGLRDLLTQAAKLGQDGDIAITMDADDTHDPASFSNFVAALNAGATMAIGSRFLADSRIIGFPLNRKCLSYGARAYFGLVMPVRGVKDYTSGYRAIRVSLIKRVLQHFGNQFVTRRGFDCQVEMLSKFAHVGGKIVEVPITYDYGLKRGESKMRVARTIRQSLATGLAMRKFNRTRI